MIGFVEQYPHPYHPVLADDAVDETVTVEVFQLRPGDWSRLIGWVGGTGERLPNGGVLVASDTEVLGRMVLGDFAVRHPDGHFTFHPADGFNNVARPVQAPE